MSGLLALLDDVAAIAKVAAASVDDVAAAAAKAGSKAAGVVIDDAAVTPKYVHGFSADRELPIIWRISLGSLRNKLFILLPGLLVLSYFAPWAITPLLMPGGSYLCFEGAEKVVHGLLPHASQVIEADFDTHDPVRLEEEKVAGAIKTDFILSAEIMTIALAAIPDSALWIEAVTLALVGTLITVAVYGAVALIVKMDDLGLHLAGRRSGFAVLVGRGLLVGTPKLLTLLSRVGTLAMLWVGGSIVMHGLHELGVMEPYATIEHWADVAAGAVPEGAAGFVVWLVTAVYDGVLGLILGALLVPLATWVIGPVMGRKAEH
ncbi:MAG: DUF808 domain-containing protein [Gemmobacter sp.]|jgi:predicted DNA repair protein MutK|nr:DUF808 domain-containing protein [Gemmobacter sp.]